MNIHDATEQAYRNGYHCGRTQVLEELVRLLESERPNPILNDYDHYETGYNNGLVMAKAIAIKLKEG